MKKSTRRSFLKKAGASAAMVPFVGSLSNLNEVQAAPVSEPGPLAPPPPFTCEYRLLRHAAAVFNYNDQTFLIDPYLNQAISNVPLPVDTQELTDIINNLDAVLLTHAHTDHINLDNWHLPLLQDKPFFCQSIADGNYLTSIGMNDVRVIGTQIEFEGITIFKTGGQHGVGTGWDVSGFVFTAPENQTVYIAGDTTFAPEVENALLVHQPDFTIVNCGAVGPVNNPWTMTAEHVGSVATTLPSTQIIAVHMEVHPNAQVTRAELRNYTLVEGISSQVMIPDDGESITLCSIVSVPELRQNAEAVTLTPNPFTDHVRVEMDEKLINIRVIDVQGKLVNTLHRPFWDGTDQFGNTVRNGMYVMLISTKTGVFTKQVLKQ